MGHLSLFAILKLFALLSLFALLKLCLPSLSLSVCLKTQLTLSMPPYLHSCRWDHDASTTWGGPVCTLVRKETAGSQNRNKHGAGGGGGGGGGGYSLLLKELGRGMDVRFSCAVDGIRCGPEGVSVCYSRTTSQTGAQGQQTQGAHGAGGGSAVPHGQTAAASASASASAAVQSSAMLSSGAEGMMSESFDYCICAVPIGVLKSESATTAFTPPLSPLCLP